MINSIWLLYAYCDIITGCTLIVNNTCSTSMSGSVVQVVPHIRQKMADFVQCITYSIRIRNVQELQISD